MSLSPARGGVFFLIGLPIGFILSALGFAVTGQAISAPEIAPFAFAIALIVGAVAAFWTPQS